MKDWLGNEFGPGDLVLYPNLTGHSPNMVLARVETLKENGNVTVLPVKGSRWDHWGRTKYTDTRTGKAVDPFRNQAEHMHAQQYLNPETGERTDDYYEAKAWSVTRVNDPFKDHIREEKVQSKVTLTVTKNITRWMGPDVNEAAAPVPE